jgi:hypothetical protein
MSLLKRTAKEVNNIPENKWYDKTNFTKYNTETKLHMPITKHALSNGSEV